MNIHIVTFREAFAKIVRKDHSDYTLNLNLIQ